MEKSIKLYIKNVVCKCCLEIVRQTFEKAGYKPEKISSGEVILKKSLTAQTRQRIAKNLKKFGLVLIEDQRDIETEKIKHLLIKMVEKEKLETHFSLSAFLTEHLKKEYSQISRLFSRNEGITIEQFLITQKIERVKQLLRFDILSTTEISKKLGYRHVSHLSAQFKKLTGLTPSEFKLKSLSEN